MELVKWFVDRFFQNEEQDEKRVKNMIDSINNRLIKLGDAKKDLTNKMYGYHAEMNVIKKEIADLYKKSRQPSASSDTYKTLAVLKLNELHKKQRLLNLDMKSICIFTNLESKLEEGLSIKNFTDILQQCNDGIKDTRQIINEDAIANIFSKLTRQMEKLDIESITDTISDSTSDINTSFNAIPEAGGLNSEHFEEEFENICRDIDRINESLVTASPSEDNSNIVNESIQKLQTMRPVSDPPINTSTSNSIPIPIPIPVPISVQTQVQKNGYTFLSGANYLTDTSKK